MSIVTAYAAIAQLRTGKNACPLNSPTSLDVITIQSEVTTLSLQKILLFVCFRFGARDPLR